MITSPHDLIKCSGMVRSVSVLAGHFPFLISGVTKLQIFFLTGEEIAKSCWISGDSQLELGENTNYIKKLWWRTPRVA